MCDHAEAALQPDQSAVGIGVRRVLSAIVEDLPTLVDAHRTGGADHRTTAGALPGWKQACWAVWDAASSRDRVTWPLVSQDRADHERLNKADFFESNELSSGASRDSNVDPRFLRTILDDRAFGTLGVRHARAKRHRPSAAFRKVCSAGCCHTSYYPHSSCLVSVAPSPVTAV